MNGQEKPLLTVKNLCLSYGKASVVENVSFTLSRGEYICLVGHNGSGKSTLMKGLLHLHPARQGEAEWSVPPEKVSYLPQSSPKDFPATVREIVLTGRQRRGQLFYTREDRQMAQRAMERLEMSEYAGRRLGELSGGQQQRALIARALCRDPEALLLDEPCAGLDSHISEDFYEMLGRLNREGLTILMASHDHDSVARWATRVIELCRTVTFDGPIDQWEGRHTHG